MRHRICTASIFAVLVGVLVASVVIRVVPPRSFTEFFSLSRESIPLLVMAVLAMIPLGVAALALFAVIVLVGMLWVAASVICARLRRES